MPIDYSGKTAIVTGAGRGLGRGYALALARRGARVVVNDVGGSRDGRGRRDEQTAAAVVDEIRALGGEAFADSGDVTDLQAMESMAARAIAEWDSIHILINNAAIIRGGKFIDMAPADFQAPIDVNLIGSANATRAVWRHMMARRYGRILMTSSGIGLYGQPDHTNYGAAKAGVVGLARTLHLEGEPHGIRVNTLAPAAATRMTNDVLPDEAIAMFDIEHVIPAALFLVSDDAPSNLILGAGAGGYNAAYVTMTRGVVIAAEDRTPEGISKNLARILDREGETLPVSCFDQVSQFAGMSVPPASK